jgi:hypothetical protein
MGRFIKPFSALGKSSIDFSNELELLAKEHSQSRTLKSV